MFKALTIACLAATLTQAARIETASTATAATATAATTADDWWVVDCDTFWSCDCMDENSDVFQLCRLLQDQFSAFTKEKYEI